jgi:diacylglycerol kinase
MAHWLAHLLRGFPPAWAGLVHLVKSERHARFHLAATAGVIATGVLLNIQREDWLWLTIAMATVWMAEAFNTSLERLADRVTQEQDPLIRQAKDLAAAGVLIAAVAAAVIGGMVLSKYWIS